MVALIPILACISVGLFVVGLMMKGERELIRDRIEVLRLTLDQDVEAIAPELAVPFADRIIQPFLNRIASIAGRVVPANVVANTAERLQRAGSPWKLKPLEFIGLKAASLAVFAVAGILLSFFLDVTIIYRALIFVVMLVVGYCLPEYLLESAIRNRQRQIRRSLADCLDLLVVSAEAGLGFDGAVAKVVEKVRGPIQQEFRKVLEDMSVGRTRVEALRGASDRLAIPEVTTFVAAIHQADQLGVSIAHVLRVQAESLRSQRNLRAREHTAKLPVKLIFPLVFFIFPSLFVVLLGPAAIEIFKALSSTVR